MCDYTELQITVGRRLMSSLIVCSRKKQNKLAKQLSSLPDAETSETGREETRGGCIRRLRLNIPITVTVALADPLTVFGGTLRSNERNRLEASKG